jgi:uncharacterized membrane-anchored protein
MTTHRATPSGTRLVLSKVPEVTAYFWIIKVLCTTVGEAAADFLNVSVNLGLTGTSIATGLLLVIVLAAQFAANRYTPVRYWSAVTLVSVFGTLVTDNLTDSLGVPLEVSTIVFGVLLAGTFTAWYRIEGTLSIHSILTRRREAFYWLAILVTFALGTAAGDLMAEVLGLGYLVSGVIVAVVIASAAVAWRLGLHPVLAFWIIYVLTRPLGASIGDYLSQPASSGGLGLGATTTSLVFVAAIIGIVGYLSVTKADVIRGAAADHRRETARETGQRGGLLQTVLVVGLLLLAGGAGYFWRYQVLQNTAVADAGPVDDSAAVVPPPGGPAAPGPTGGAQKARPTTRLGDLSSFRVITQDTLRMVGNGDQSGATTRVTDLETAWDDAQARLKPRDSAAWTELDSKIDKVLREVRSTSPDPATEKDALNALLAALG